MFTRYHVAILERLYNLRCIGGKHTSRENALRGFPKSERGEGSDALEDLVRRNYIILKRTSYGDQIFLNLQHIQDIKRILNPGTSIALDKPPIEESLNTRYDKRPCHTSLGDKLVKGIRAKYSYHRGLSDSSKFIAYVIVDGEKKSSFELGSTNEKESILSKTVRGLDAKFGKRVFTKPDLYSLGKDIEGNRQLPKAIVDVLIIEGYVEQIGKRKYQRTNKQLPQYGLDAFKQEAAAQVDIVATDRKDNVAH